MIGSALACYLPEKRQCPGLPFGKTVAGPPAFVRSQAGETVRVKPTRTKANKTSRRSPLSESIDELTVNFEDDNGQTIVRELDKVVLSRGLWTTIIFRFQEWRPEKDDFGPDKYSVRRYKKINGVYRAQSKFTISSPDQAKKIVEILNGWLAEAGEQA